MILSVLSGFSVAITIVVAPLFGYLGLIAVSALVRGRARRPETGPARRARFLFVIPAHDEEGTIRATVASCRAVDYDPALYGVAVIADNCTDATARMARESGAAVVERRDREHRSKGHALADFFGGRLADGLGAEYDAAVVLDADTVVDPGLLAAFSDALAEDRDWLQCYYSVSNPDASWRTRLMTYAFSLFNGAWLLGQEGLGLSATLRGNGMCFTARGLARVPWQVHGLAEDLEFSCLLRLRGERVGFVPHVRVLGEMVRRGREAASQRRRWEVGRAAARRQFLGALLRSKTLRWRAKVLYALDLLFPPLSTLFAGLLAASCVHLWPLIAARPVPVAQALLPIHGLMAAVLATYALVPFLVLRLPARYLGTLLALPYYMAWKTLVRAGRRPTEWVRTRREPRPES